MQSLFTSQGESRPWSVQVLARRGRRYALATRGLSERTSREEWGWWGSSQWDRCNSKEIESCLLLLRTYLASYDAMNISGLCEISKSESRSSDHIGQRLAAIDPNSNLIQHCCKTRMQNEVIDRGWGGICLVVEATWQDSRQVDSDHSVLYPALDQVTDYIVLYDESRETNKTNNYKHNALLQNKCSLYLQSYHFA